jgi:hypothetical protein
MKKKELLDLLRANHKSDELELKLALYERINGILPIMTDRDRYFKIKYIHFFVDFKKNIVSFITDCGINFEGLAELSNILGTKEINISPDAEEYHEYSSHGISSYQEITCLNCDLTKIT